MNKSKSGFTIVELLIVIIVTAILAAITIVAYNGVQQRARITAMHTGLNSAYKLLEVYKIDHGSYPKGVATSVWRPLLEKAANSGDISTSTKLAVCSHSNGERYALASYGFMNTPIPTSGGTFFYISSTTGKVSTAPFSTAPAGMYTITHMCSIIFGDQDSTSTWSHALYS